MPAERYDAVVAAGALPVTSRELADRLTRAGLRRRKGLVLGPRATGQPLVRAQRLQVGDVVAVPAPAGPVDPERLAAGIDVLTSWGLVPRVLPGVLSGVQGSVLPGSQAGAGAMAGSAAAGYLAARDEERAADLTAAWCDPAVSAVWCARGGYGSQRILDRLDWARLADSRPPVLVGFSDITAMHQAFGARLGMSTLHGPVVTSLGVATEESRAYVRRLLFEDSRGVSLTPGAASVLLPGEAEGVLVGGNLTVLASQVGTAGAWSAEGAIVVLEDVGEPLYRLDRAVTQLIRSGWFSGVRGVALGQFSDCGPVEPLASLFSERLAPLGVPVIGGLAVGHVDGNLAFPLGVPAWLETSAQGGQLVLTTSALR